MCDKTELYLKNYAHWLFKNYIVRVIVFIMYKLIPNQLAYEEINKH